MPVGVLEGAPAGFFIRGNPAEGLSESPGPDVTFGTPSAGLQAVTVTIPKSAAGPGGKLFGRLQAVKLP